MPIQAPTPLSSPQGRRRRLRRLFTKLKHNQADDVPIPNPTIFEIKFYLKTSRRCHRVFVADEGDPSQNVPIIISELIPNFISSQLDAQRIADQDRQSVQLSTVLVFLSRHFAINPIRYASSPTLFCWRDTDHRRTFCVFAYLNCRMDSRTYSATELLSLRGSNGSDTSPDLLTKLKSDPEIDGVVTKEKGNVPEPQARASKKQKGISSSSTESEEVVFRGQKNSRQPGSEVQWKYRGRTGSEVTSNEPIPAPTGLGKQHSEGFQRFFKAVVSPTHVRVTAGGRIVPNTRGSASPTAKWDKEQASTDPQVQAQDSGMVEKELKVEPAYPMVQNQLAPPLVPPVFSVHPPMVFHHMGIPMPIYPSGQTPVQHGLSYHYGFVPSGAQFADAQFLSLPPGEQRTEVAGVEYKQSGREKNEDKLRQAPVKISPPAQFDQNRPFYFNGQLIFPHGGMGPGPMHPVAPNSYFQHGALATPAYAAARMVPMNHPAPEMHMGGPDGQLQYPLVPERAPVPQQYLPAPVQPHPPPPPPPAPAPISEAVPHFSSIRPSEITRRQLKGLRGSLKFYVNQLEYNKHQIDEPWVFAQAKRVQALIEQFEQTLDSQIRYEAMHYPNMEPTPRHISSGNTSFRTPSRPPSIRHAQATGSSRHGSKRSSGPVPATRFPQPQHVGTGNRVFPKPNRAAVGINSTANDNSTEHIDRLEAELVHKFSQPDATAEQKKYLEAITRPLNPKHDPKPSKTQQNSGDNSSSNSSGQPYLGVKNDAQEQQQSYGHSQQGGREAIPSVTGYSANGNAPYIVPFNADGRSLPYLIGNFPPGVDPWTYRGHEFVYERELTEAEKQARRVYWGESSGKGTGLPRFDGKDFYPPSLEKTANSKADNHNKPSSRPNVDYRFELKHSEVDPFRSSRDRDSIRSHESGRKFSKAIPIVAPPDADKNKNTVCKAPAPNQAKAKEGTGEVDKLTESLRGAKLASSGESAARGSQKKSPSLSRRAVERSSAKSGNELWQTMLKKGSASGNVLPGALSPTTATGYLPQYSGNAIASLGPTVSNNPTSRVSPNADDKFVELEGSRAPMEKIGENCPPSSAPSMETGITKDLHERMLRDAARRGVIGSDWQ